MYYQDQVSLPGQYFVLLKGALSHFQNAFISPVLTPCIKLRIKFPKPFETMVFLVITTLSFTYIWFKEHTNAVCSSLQRYSTKEKDE